MKTKHIEITTLKKIQSGSLEEKLQSMSDAVEQNGDFFGGDAHLFSTYSDRVVVFVEDKGFLSADYTVGDSVVFRNLRPEAGTVFLDEDALISRGVDAIIGGGDVSQILGTLINSVPREIKIENRLSAFLDTDRTWSKYICGDTRDRIREYVGEGTRFHSRRYVDDSVIVIDGVSLSRSLSGLSVAIGKMAARVQSSVDDYKDATSGERTEEIDNVLCQFDSVADDFAEAINEASDLVSFAIKTKGKDRRMAARIHNAIADSMNDLQLGHDFIVKMSGELKAV